MCWTNLLCLYRFVRFVNTPEILERVYTTESEILQIEEAIAIQGNNSIGIGTVSKYLNLTAFLNSTTTIKLFILLSTVPVGGRKPNKTSGKH